MQLENYYGILQVNQNASNEEIKKSFRNLAKKYHPDKHGSNAKWAEQKIKLIIKAHNTLTDDNLRRHYDLQLTETQYFETKPNRKGKNKNGVPDQVKSVLNDLVNNNGKKAIENFEYIKKNTKDFALNKYLKGIDYLDCMFLLAEEYEKSGNYGLAVKYYSNVYNLAKSKTDNNKYGFFFDETKDKIKKIYCKKLAKKTPTKKAIENYQNVLKLHINKNERAYIYKKISECYFEIGEFESAVANLNTALNLKPTLKGISKIQTRLNNHFATTATN